MITVQDDHINKKVFRIDLKSSERNLMMDITFNNDEKVVKYDVVNCNNPSIPHEGVITKSTYPEIYECLKASDTEIRIQRVISDTDDELLRYRIVCAYNREYFINACVV